MSRGILEYGKPVSAIGVGGGIYQIALYYVTALSFKVFEVAEWAGRFPSVIASLVLINLGFFVGKKLFNTKVAIVVALLLSFSQIQLAWSTQLRPYVWLELFTLLNIYYLYGYLKASHVVIDRNLVFAFLISGVSILFHGTGLLNILIIFLVFLYKLLSTRQYKYFLLLPIFVLVGYWVIFNSFAGRWDDISRSLFRFYFSPLHYRIFLTHNYLWLIIGSFIGFVTLMRRNLELALLLGGSILLIFLVAIFKISPNYVRYSLPAFPLMYILFAEGVVYVIEKITKKEYLRWSLVILIFVLLNFTGKLVFWPKYYYSINADMRENPIADYKFAFSRIRDLIGDRENTLVIDAWNDRVPWYLPGQEFIMTNFANPNGRDSTYGEKLSGTLDAVKSEISSHGGGVVVVEDWQSLMTEDIKDYVRKNLKFEFTAQDLPYNENDHWGISVYSWGI
jgi:4-amino-4-deoxy-L-arabinose transferase-like glycosyltransferase